MIYLDQSATSWPKAPGVSERIKACLEEIPGNPGRGSHRWAVQSESIMDNVRASLARYFKAPGPEYCSYHLNATDALNMALRGCLRKDDHVITSHTAHNALARPLRLLEEEGLITVDHIPCLQGKMDYHLLKQALRPDTRMLALTHMSNVTGECEDLYRIKEILQPYPDILLLLDAAQSAGHEEIDMEAMGVDLLAWSGHKALLGPMGTGGLLLSKKAAEMIQPHRVGGSGGDSRDAFQPRELPWRLEAGTPNLPGIAGLGAALEYIHATGTAALQKKCIQAGKLIHEGLLRIQGMKIYTDSDNPFIISFSHPLLSVSQWSALLDTEFGIATRSGLHCAPAMHRSLGSYPEGLVRISCGPFNTADQAVEALAAIKEIAGKS